MTVPSGGKRPRPGGLWLLLAARRWLCQIISREPIGLPPGRLRSVQFGLRRATRRCPHARDMTGSLTAVQRRCRTSADRRKFALYEGTNQIQRLVMAK